MRRRQACYPKWAAVARVSISPKIAGDGSELPASATSWSCVRDNVTGVYWEVKTDDGGLRDKDWTYTWYEPDYSRNGGIAGTQNGGSCVGSRCDTDGYVAAVNVVGLCGYRDWRLPTKQELQGLVDYGIPHLGPTIDTAYFPNTMTDTWYWSSSVSAYRADFAWYIFFSYGFYGNVNASYKTHSPHVRLARGGQ